MTAVGLPKCWGLNTSGQLGDDSTTQRTSPALITDITDGMSKLSTGRNHTCALRTDGIVMCWGENGSAQIGDGRSANRTHATVASKVSGTVQSLALGGNSSCAVLADGHGIGWGNNDYGRLGNGSLTTTLPIPERIAEWFQQTWLESDLIFRDDFSDEMKRLVGDAVDRVADQRLSVVRSDKAKHDACKVVIWGVECAVRGKLREPAGGFPVEGQKVHADERAAVRIGRCSIDGTSLPSPSLRNRSPRDWPARRRK